MTTTKAPAIAVAALLLVAPSVLCLDVHDFAGGSPQATAVLDPPAFYDTVNLTLPAECSVLGANVNVTGLPALSEPSVYPGSVTLSLDGKVLWAFKGKGYGDLGRQTAFSDDVRNFTARFGPSGGSALTAVKLPLGATVTDASLEVDCSGPGRLLKLADIPSTASPGQFGGAVSPAGDFNADGFGDFVVGARTDTAGGVNAGRTFLYYGGPSPDTEPALVFTGGPGDVLGYSVAAAGDLNGDGYDDIAIGAARCSATAYEAGRVLVYYGGRNPDNVADVILNGTFNERFGTSVSGLGDFNGDGYDDLAVGSDTSNISNDPGRAYVFFGGSPMSRTPGLRLAGEAAGDYFGFPVAGAGDVNGDGYTDLAAGAILNDAGAPNAGRAYVFLGGPAPDGDADVVITGQRTYGWLGYSVSGAGDFDDDGYDDILVGAPMDDSGGVSSGAVYLLRGGPSMDGVPDLIWTGAPYENLGFSVSGAGDVNGDGIDDIITGAPQNSSGGASAGVARVFFGGRLHNTSDIVLLGGPGDSMGWPVSGAGNLNGDGLDELLLGMPYCDLGGTNAGRVLVVSQGNFVTEPGLRIGAEAVWDPKADFAGTKELKDIAGALNRQLAKATPSGTDAYGNLMAEIPLELFSGGEGTLVLDHLDVRYHWSARVRDFSSELNQFIALHKAERDRSGNLTVPLEIHASTAGRTDLSGLNVSIDEAPFWTGNVPGLRLDEDTAEGKLLDLRNHFRDDLDPTAWLRFSVVSADPPGIVGFDITDGHFLSADALTGAANDNWTGAVSVVVSCTDSTGLTRLSDPFTITVVEVNDAPVVTSTPVTEAFAGRNYEYRVIAVHSEGGPVIFSLASGPEGMSIDSSSGVLRWRPEEAGSFPVSISVSDGSASSFQNFTILVSVINKPPRIVSAPVTEATAGIPYIYEARAVDPDGDELEYSLAAWPGGMSIGRLDGRINWTPSRELSGNFTVAIRASDGNGGEARQDFTLSVQPFARPRLSINAPAAGKTISGKYIFSGAASPGSLPVTAVRVRLDSGEWKDATGNATWGFAQDTTKLKNGPHLLEARASDGTTFSDVASVRFTVDNGSSGGAMPPVSQIGAVLIIVAIVGSAAIVHLRRRRRSPKKYDWGPD